MTLFPEGVYETGDVIRHVDTVYRSWYICHRHTQTCRWKDFSCSVAIPQMLHRNL